MLKSLFILSLLVCNSLCFFRQCHLGYPQPTNVVSPNCDATNCRVIIGSSLQGTVTFTPTASHSNLEAFLEVFIAGAWRDFPVSSPNNIACDFMSPGCPTTPNVQQTWNINIPINPAYDEVASTSWEFYLVDMNALSVVTCFQVTADLVRA